MNRRQIGERAEERCEYCRAPERVAGYAFMVDHILPRSRDGGNDPSNLALLISRESRASLPPAGQPFRAFK